MMLPSGGERDIQELLAPSIVQFLNHDWEAVGDEHTLHEEIAKATGIPSDVITKARDFDNVDSKNGDANRNSF